MEELFFDPKSYGCDTNEELYAFWFKCLAVRI